MGNTIYLENTLNFINSHNMNRISFDTMMNRISGHSGTLCATLPSLAAGFTSKMFFVYWTENDLCIKDPESGCYVAVDKSMILMLEETPCSNGDTEYEITTTDEGTITIDIAAEKSVLPEN